MNDRRPTQARLRVIQPEKVNGSPKNLTDAPMFADATRWASTGKPGSHKPAANASAPSALVDRHRGWVDENAAVDWTLVRRLKRQSVDKVEDLAKQYRQRHDREASPDDLRELGKPIISSVVADHARAAAAGGELWAPMVPGGEDDVDRAMSEFPPPGTELRRLYLDAHSGQLAFDPAADPASKRYSADDGVSRVEFTHRFAEDTELIGFPTLHLQMEAADANDADVFVIVQKLDKDGALLVTRTVPFTDPDVLAQTQAGFEAGVPEVRILFHEGPWGSVRASHRELDPASSTADDPVLRHQGEEKVTPGKNFTVVIPMTPMATRWRAGEQLRLGVAGFKLSASTPPSVRYVSGEMTPPRTINHGDHIIHTGGDNESYLVVPIARSA